MENVVSLQRAYENKKILVTGCTGFLGKMAVELLISNIGTAAEIFLLIRGKSQEAVEARFRNEILPTLLQRGKGEPQIEVLRAIIAQKVRILKGDLSMDCMGLKPETWNYLKKNLDLLFNISGEVSFTPEIRDAVKNNVNSLKIICKLIGTSDHCRLVHTSTSFVSGYLEKGPDEFKERLLNKLTPNGRQFDVATELKYWHDTIADYEQRGMQSGLKNLGFAHARNLGWQNTYTYSKALGEHLICDRLHPDRFVIVRPSIVEASMLLPFPGWHDGFKTFGPIIIAVRQIPLSPADMSALLDTIPVDVCALGTLLAGANVMAKQHKRVYHLTTSQAHPLSSGDVAAAIRNFYFDRLKRTNSLKAKFYPKEIRAITFGQFKFATAAVRKVSEYVTRHTLNASPIVQKMGIDPLNRASKSLHTLFKIYEIYHPFMGRKQFINESTIFNDVKFSEPTLDELRDSMEHINWPDYLANVLIPSVERMYEKFIEQRKAEKEKAKAAPPAESFTGPVLQDTEIQTSIPAA